VEEGRDGKVEDRGDGMSCESCSLWVTGLYKRILVVVSAMCHYRCSRLLPARHRVS
jgi:hypothetical protein